MRKLLFCGLLFWLAVPLNANAAYGGGWCAVVDYGNGSVTEKCSYRSFEACQAEARSWGSTSFCRTSGYPTSNGYAPANKKRKHGY